MEIPGSVDALEDRVRTLLPEQYQDSYEDVQPVSMGSAGLKYGPDGKVAWADIWGSFCDLAMAGGPPHKGKLLEPGSPAEIAADYERYVDVADEICRGIRLATGLKATLSYVSGWLSMGCESETAADWLVRAITMENVSAAREGDVLYLPVGAAYRIEKEVKNVVTAVAKTSHYWFDHTWPSQKREIGDLLSQMAAAAPLLRPAFPEDSCEPERQQALSETIRQRVEPATGLRPSAHAYLGWCGFECPDVGSAIWMMRALVASNVLSRREDLTLFVPVNSAGDPGGNRAVDTLVQIRALAEERLTGPRQ
jgi:hypothetical protein